MIDPIPVRPSSRVKGSIFSKVVKGIRKLGEDACARVPDRLRHHLEARVLDTTWHPEGDYFELMQFLAAELPDPGMDVWEWMGRNAARIDYEGVYRILLKPGNPAGTLTSFETLWRLRHDSGSAQVTVKEGGRATVDLAGYALESEEIYRAIRGTLWETLNQSGATEIAIDLVRAPTRGDDRCSWQLLWKE